MVIGMVIGMVIRVGSSGSRLPKVEEATGRVVDRVRVEDEVTVARPEDAALGGGEHLGGGGGG